jgi:hypothetical protein
VINVRLGIADGGHSILAVDRPDGGLWSFRRGERRQILHQCAQQAEQAGCTSLGVGHRFQGRIMHLPYTQDSRER